MNLQPLKNSFRIPTKAKTLFAILAIDLKSNANLLIQYGSLHADPQINLHIHIMNKKIKLIIIINHSFSTPARNLR